MNNTENNNSVETAVKVDDIGVSADTTGEIKTVMTASNQDLMTIAPTTTTSYNVNVEVSQNTKNVTDDAANHVSSPGSIMMSGLSMTDSTVTQSSNLLSENKVDNAGDGKTQVSFTRILPSMVPIVYDSNGNVDIDGVPGGSGGVVEVKAGNIVESPAIERSNTVPIHTPKNINVDMLQAALAGTFGADPTIRKPTLPLPVGWAFQAGNTHTQQPGYYTNDYLAPGTPQKRRIKAEEEATPTKTPSRVGLKVLVEAVAPLKEKKYLVLTNPASVESAL